MQENIRSRRLIVFDLCKLFAIFLVLWGHSIQSFVSTDYTNDLLWKILQSFHMPLFMIMAGFFASRSLELSFWLFLRKKFTQLILPCLTWGVLIYGIRKCISDQGFSLLEIFYGNFWFLKSVFICYVLAWISCKIEKLLHAKYWGTSLMIVVSLFIPQFNVIRLFPCFLIGIFLKRKKNAIFEKNRGLLAMIVSLILYIILFSLSQKSHWVYGSVSAFWCDPVLFQSFAMGYLCRILMGVLASFFIIFCFYSFFSSAQYDKGFLSRLAEMGQYTLGIYIVQTYLLEKALAAIINLDSINYWVAYFVLMPIISMMMIGICATIVRVMSRNKWIALFFYGKEFRK